MDVPICSPDIETTATYRCHQTTQRYNRTIWVIIPKLWWNYNALSFYIWHIVTDVFTCSLYVFPIKLCCSNNTIIDTVKPYIWILPRYIPIYKLLWKLLSTASEDANICDKSRKYLQTRISETQKTLRQISQIFADRISKTQKTFAYPQIFEWRINICKNTTKHRQIIANICRPIFQIPKKHLRIRGRSRRPDFKNPKNICVSACKYLRDNIWYLQKLWKVMNEY
jgi:hypothetical protein